MHQDYDFYITFALVRKQTTLGGKLFHGYPLYLFVL